MQDSSPTSMTNDEIELLKKLDEENRYIFLFVYLYVFFCFSCFCKDVLKLILNLQQVSTFKHLDTIGHHPNYIINKVDKIQYQVN